MPVSEIVQSLYRRAIEEGHNGGQPRRCGSIRNPTRLFHCGRYLRHPVPQPDMRGRPIRKFVPDTYHFDG